MTADKTSPQSSGVTIKLSCSAKSNSRIQYRYRRIKDGVETIFRDFSYSTDAACNPGTGVYRIFVDAKEDDTNQIVTAEIPYTWS